MVLTEPTCIWWCGPEWFNQPKENWPASFKPTVASEDAQASVEFKKVTTLLVNATSVPDSMDDFSTLNRLLRYTAYVFRAYGNAAADGLNRPELRRDGVLTTSELTLAKKLWIRHIQRVAFSSELRELQNGERVLHTSSLSKLNPFLDKSDGIIKMRGRTELSSDLAASPNLPILPNKVPGRNGQVPHFLVLLIRNVHFQLMHAGVRDTLTEIRQGYWIVKGRQVVKKILNACVQCNKIQRKPFQQPTAPLPADRCSFSPPFAVTGLDFAGPFYLKETRDKAWMCLFTCAVTRAVHLELVRSMSTPCFLMALERFFSRRGIPRIIYSDNARTFK